MQYLTGKSEGSSTCYDEKLDPKGEEYKGFANTTESGRTCQVTQEGLKTSQELRMLSRSLSDCKSLLLNVMNQVCNLSEMVNCVTNSLNYS